LMPPFGENHPEHLWHLQSMSCPLVSRENRLYFQVESPSIHEDVLVISNTEVSRNDKQMEENSQSTASLILCMGNQTLTKMRA
jgi:hypothetical protein